MSKLVPFGQTSILPMREQELVNECLSLLNQSGHFAYRVNQGAVTAEYKGRKRYIEFNKVKGIADIIGTIQPMGRSLAVECKIYPNKPTQNQLWFLDMVRSRGGVALVCYTVDDLISGIKSALAVAEAERTFI